MPSNERGPYFTVNIEAQSPDGRTYRIAADGEDPVALAAQLQALEKSVAGDPAVINFVPPQYRTTGGR